MIRELHRIELQPTDVLCVEVNGVDGQPITAEDCEAVRLSIVEALTKAGLSNEVVATRNVTLRFAAVAAK
jgi:hypothetical protein